MCKCKDNNWCRIWEETLNGKYPPSEHAPGCDEYKQEEFTKLTLDGIGCIVEKGEAEQIIKDNPEDDYTTMPIFLTRDQFERFPEFTGF